MTVENEPQIMKNHGVEILDEFVITRQGKRYVLYAGLLHGVHGMGLKSVETEILKILKDAEGGIVPVVQATIVLEDGRKFQGIGDASADNVGRNIIPHLIRMAETRAKARAFRDALDVSYEVLDDAPSDDQANARTNAQPAQRPAASGSARKGGNQSTGTRTPEREPAASGGDSGGLPIQSETAKEIFRLSAEIWGDARAVENRVLNNVKVEELRDAQGVRLIGGLNKTLQKVRDQARASAEDLRGAAVPDDGDAPGDDDDPGPNVDEEGIDVSEDEVDDVMRAAGV